MTLTRSANQLQRGQTRGGCAIGLAAWSHTITIGHREERNPRSLSRPIDGPICHKDRQNSPSGSGRGFGRTDCADPLPRLRWSNASDGPLTVGDWRFFHRGGLYGMGTAKRNSVSRVFRRAEHRSVVRITNFRALSACRCQNPPCAPSGLRQQRWVCQLMLLAAVSGTLSVVIDRSRRAVGMPAEPALGQVRTAIWQANIAARRMTLAWR
jgi:hypothetical protein